MEDKTSSVLFNLKDVVAERSNIIQILKTDFLKKIICSIVYSFILIISVFYFFSFYFVLFIIHIYIHTYTHAYYIYINILIL